MSTPFAPPPEFDDYLIVQELGRGSMGHVYLAEDAVLARHVAIKFMGGADPDVEARQRFIMEARAAARIQHPNVVNIYRVGELAERPFIVSELIRGKSLRELPHPAPWRDVLAYGIELARGLAAAHRRGVVHCDVKPDNAMITDDGVPKLVDFGLARFVAEGSDDGDGPMVGTPDYMAPEVWRGRAPSRRSDVYSFGALLFELVAGAAPFAGRELRALADVVQREDAPSLSALVPDVDARFARVVARCLERDPERRYGSGEELREALEQLHPTRTTVTGQGENPYRGLRPFEATHRGMFFGRALEISAVVERLRTDAVVLVTGDSGVGKSSLLRAGVIPAISDGALGQGRRWEVVTMIPGRRPLEALALALGDPGLASRVLDDPENLPRELQRRAGDGSLLLFVDQMEELITVAEPAQASAFEAGLARISEGMPGVRLVTTVRADFLSRIAALPRLGREMSRLLYFLSPLPPERIRDVITGPATASGVTFESEALIESLVEATAQAGSGGLPLLSFALAELWEARDRERSLVTGAALEAMGGVAGALARHGDNVLSKMSTPDRANARRVMLRLVTALGTRVRRTEAELAIGDGTRAALDALVRGRLLVVLDGESGTTYELAHEVLVHGWGTLREWLDDDAEDRARRERVAAAAAEWHKAGRRRDLTFQGPRLVEAAALDARELTPLEREFIAGSLRVARRRRWMMRATVVAVLVIVVVATLVQRHLAHARVARAVAIELDAAAPVLAAARAADRAGQETAARAFAAFDAGRTDEGEALWKQVVARRALAEASYREAASRVETALAKDPSRSDVRDLLGDVVLARAELADAMRVADRRDELVSRLAAYDASGARRVHWQRAGHVALHAPAGAVVALERDGAVVASGAGPLEVAVPAGSYTATAHAPGHERVVLPVLVGRGERTTARLELPRAGSVPAGFVYVPAGAFLYGSPADEDLRLNFFQAVPMHPRTSGAFLIERTEVTVAAWLAFVDAMPAAQQRELLPDIPTQMSGALAIERGERGWQLSMQPVEHRYTAAWGAPIEYAGRSRHARHDWRKFPITGITPRQLEQYTAWLDRTGRVPGARLCTELEWERAARGADGREYPHGARLAEDDANFDVTYGREAMGLDEVGSHPASISPFGVLDTSGNAFEWTRPERGDGYIVRSGSYFHDRKTANLANRSTMNASVRDITLGARVCASVRPAMFH